MHRYLFRKKSSLILYAILAPLSAISSVLVAGAMAAAVDYAGGGELSDIWGYLIFFGVYIALDFLVDTGARLARLRIVKNTAASLMSDVYNKIVHMPYLAFSRRNSADYIANLTADVDVLRDCYFGVLLSLYMTFLRFTIALVVLIWMSPLLGVFVLVNAVLQTAVPLLYAKRLEKAGEAYSNAQERHLLVMKEGLSAFLATKVFHMEDALACRYRGAMDAAEECRRKKDGLRELSSNVSFIFSTITHLGVFLLGAVLSLQGLITIAEVVAASQLIVYISSPIYNLNMDLADLRTARVSAKKLEDLLNSESDVGGSEELAHPSGQLQVRNLCFAYGDREILSNITYDFEPGKKYLITGSSGSGKSTLLSLAAGLRADCAGEILLGGVDIRRLSRKSLTESLCIISQEPFLFDDTLYNNICFYQTFDEDSVIQALHQVGLKDRLSSLPNGVHTMIGENASSLSGGEKQRVAIARALVRRTPILLLDESTSHLDPATAAEIEELVLGLDQITVLLVSHNATHAAKKRFDERLEMGSGRLCPIEQVP